MFNRIHKMDVVHQRLAQEWKELHLVIEFLDELDQLVEELSLLEEESLQQNQWQTIKHLGETLESIRQESVSSQDFEEPDHVDAEKKDFADMYFGFQSLLVAVDRQNQASFLNQDFSRLSVLVQLKQVRLIASQLQDFYLEEVREVSQEAQKTRRQILQRAVVVSVFLLLFLGGTVVVFIYLINKHSQTMLDQEKNLTISLLAQSLSHEIRNPLGIIKSATSVFRQKFAKDSEEYELTGYLDDEVDRIDALINQLLQLKADSSAHRQPENPEELLQQVILLLTGVSHKSSVRLVIHNEAPNRSIICDRNQMKQAFINVLLNAIEASPPNSEVRVRCWVDGKYYYIDIHDQGSGFKEKEAKQAFEPFFTTKSNGSGLGLYVVKQIIESNKGKIDALASSRGMVRIILPLAEER